MKIINPEQQAEQLSIDLNLTYPIVPEILCKQISSDSFQIGYSEESFDSKDIFGLAIGNERAAKIAVNAKISERRKLFTAIHEVGHVVLHIQTGQKTNFQCSSEDIRENIRVQMEKEANSFSAALLMPRYLVEKKINQNDLSWQLIQEISEEYRTSLEAAGRRVIAITKAPAALIIYQNNVMRGLIKSRAFPLNISASVFPKYLESFIVSKKTQLPDTLESCDLTDWGINSNRGYKCFYSLLEFGTQNRKMALIQLEEIDEDNPGEWDEPHY